MHDKVVEREISSVRIHFVENFRVVGRVWQTIGIVDPTPSTPSTTSDS